MSHAVGGPCFVYTGSIQLRCITPFDDMQLHQVPFALLLLPTSSKLDGHCQVSTINLL